MKNPLQPRASCSRLSVLAVLSVLFLSVGCQSAPASQIDGGTATQPVARGGNWPARHERYLELSRAGGVEVMFLGDSITDRWRNPSEGQAIWDAEMAPLGAANYGIGGDRTQHVLWRLQNGELDGISPKVVVLMIGTNNTGFEKGTKTPRNTVPEIAAGVRAVAAELRTRRPDARILLLGVFPRAERPDHPQRLQVAAINADIAALHDGRHVFYLDFGDRFLNEDGTMSREIMPDFLHPGPAGYRVWADAIRQPLQVLLNDSRVNWSKVSR